MNDAFAWDVGDYAKFALLDHLVSRDASGPRLRLGTVWCYSTWSPPPGHGQFVEYLDPRTALGRRLRPRAADLYDRMRAGFRTGRTIGSHAYRSMLAPDTAHVFDRLTSATEERRGYWTKALAATRRADVVFFDPDNGIRIPGKLPNDTHVALDELVPFHRRGQTLVVYQHGNREPGLARERRRVLEAALGTRVLALSWHRLQYRIFFVIPARRHAALLSARVARFLDAWQPDFRDAAAA